MVPLTAQAGHAGDSPCPSNPDKCYSFTMSTAPAAPHAGELTQYTGTLTNLSKGGTGVQIGSANITWDPSNAFLTFATGSVSRAGASETLAGGALQLRDLNTSPGDSVSFTFSGRARAGITITFSSDVKQANNFSGLPGNSLARYGAAPTTSISASCGGFLPYNSYGCAAFLKSVGATIVSGPLDSDGNPAQVRATLRVPPVTPLPGSPVYQVMGLRTYLDGEGCPVEPIDCDFVVQLLNVLDVEYDGDHSATLTISCGSLCGPLAVIFQQDESTGVTEPMLPCLPTGPLASPISGSTVCGTNNGDGTLSIYNITHINDYKVMVAGIPVG